MKSVFADAGYWIALFNPRDQLHSRAIAASQNNKDSLIVTSEGVLTEFLNHFASFGPPFRHRAFLVVISLHQARNVEIVPQTSELLHMAAELYSQRPDKECGITDCASFIIMQQQGITEALAYDEHFRQAGFTRLLK